MAFKNGFFLYLFSAPFNCFQRLKYMYAYDLIKFQILLENNSYVLMFTHLLIPGALSDEDVGDHGLPQLPIYVVFNFISLLEYGNSYTVHADE